MVTLPKWASRASQSESTPSIYSYAKGNPKGVYDALDPAEDEKPLLGYDFPMRGLTRAVKAAIIAEYPSAQFVQNRPQVKLHPELLVLRGDEALRFYSARQHYKQEQLGFTAKQRGKPLVSEEVIDRIAEHAASYHSTHDFGSRKSTMTITPSAEIAEALEEFKTHYGAAVTIDPVNTQGLVPVRLTGAPAELVHEAKRDIGEVCGPSSLPGRA